MTILVSGLSSNYSPLLENHRQINVVLGLYAESEDVGRGADVARPVGGRHGPGVDAVGQRVYLAAIGERQGRVAAQSQGIGHRAGEGVGYVAPVEGDAVGGGQRPVGRRDQARRGGRRGVYRQSPGIGITRGDLFAFVKGLRRPGVHSVGQAQAVPGSRRGGQRVADLERVIRGHEPGRPLESDRARIVQVLVGRRDERRASRELGAVGQDRRKDGVKDCRQICRI